MVERGSPLEGEKELGCDWGSSLHRGRERMTNDPLTDGPQTTDAPKGSQKSGTRRLTESLCGVWPSDELGQTCFDVAVQGVYWYVLST